MDLLFENFKQTKLLPSVFFLWWPRTAIVKKNKNKKK